MGLVDSDRQVRTQDPRPGIALNGQPVTFGAVKFVSGPRSAGG